MKTYIKVFLTIGIIIILIVIVGYFALNTGQQVDTVWNEQDYQSGLEKSQVQIDNIEEINLEALVKEDFSTNGTNNIDDFFTNEEMSALIAMANDSKGPFKNFKVRFDDNGKGAISFDLSDRFTNFLTESRILEKSSYQVQNHWSTQYLVASSGRNNLTDLVVGYITYAANNKPVYATGSLSRDSANSIQLNIDKLYVGRIPMNANVIKRVEWEVERIVNMIITPENGFHIEELRVEEGKLYYKGTLPSEIEGVKIQ